MRIAALYDIHGNLPALEAVLEEVRRSAVDLVIVGGDVVPGPMMRETLERLRNLGIPMQFIQGNCEVALLAERRGTEPPAWYRTVPEGAKEVLRWQAQHLHPEHERLFAIWPMTLR